jgi:hypothetical protein
MARPGDKTIKRLFAISHNLCAFPKCNNTLVDKNSGKVTGRICHIKGNRPGSKRYDALQSEAERHGFDNLILLCPIHHDVIDDDDVAYTVTRLLAMKKSHEERTIAHGTPELDAAQIQQLLNNIEDNTISDGSIIVTNNQLGGQVAHKIVNIGPQPRSISDAAIWAIATAVHQFPPHDYEINVNHNDADGSNLAYQFTQILNSARWNCLTHASCMFPRPMFGITISYPTRTPAVSTFIDAIGKLGFRVKEEHEPSLRFVSILVGYRENGV